MEEQREILRHFRVGSLPEEGFDHTKYAYHYEHVGANGTFIWQSKMLGWDTVRGDMPENPDMRDASGRCIVGDVVLMRMPKARFAQIEREGIELRREREGVQTKEQVQADIDDKMSKLLGHKVKTAFEFHDPKELNSRR